MITVTRDTPHSRHIVSVGAHRFTVDIPAGDGGAGDGPDPHDLYDAALGACKALTVLWFAQRRGLPVGDIAVSVTRDASAERDGHYRLATTLTLGGALSDEQRQTLLGVAERCPVHKLMTQVTTEITTALAD